MSISPALVQKTCRPHGAVAVRAGAAG